MLDSRAVYLQASILGAVTMLHHRHSAALLPKSLVESLKNMVRNNSSSIIRHQALGLLNDMTGQEGVAAFLAEYPEPDRDSRTLGEHPDA